MRYPICLLVHIYIILTYLVTYTHRHGAISTARIASTSGPASRRTRHFSVSYFILIPPLVSSWKQPISDRSRSTVEYPGVWHPISASGEGERHL